MAIAPLNKFRTIAVPVAPGVSTVYTAPTGTSAIVLSATVANVGIGTTYPKVTFTHQRKNLSTRTKGNIINNRVVKEIEIPPNDSLIIVEGKLVLERTALVEDSIVVSGIQSGIVNISNVVYDNSTGLTTVTANGHGFLVGDEITMSGIAFTCSPGGNYGLTTTIYPKPQRGFTVDTVVDVNNFETNTGVVVGIAHTYVSGGQVGPLQMELVMSILENSTS